MDVEIHERHYELSEFVRLLHVSVTTGRRWLAKGKVRSVRVGHKHLIPESEVKRLLLEASQRGTR